MEIHLLFFLRCLFVVWFSLFFFQFFLLSISFYLAFHLIFHIITYHHILSFISLHCIFICIVHELEFSMDLPIWWFGQLCWFTPLGWPGISRWLPLFIWCSDLPLDDPGLVIDLLTTLFDRKTFWLVYLLWLIVIFSLFIHWFIWCYSSLHPVCYCDVVLVRG